MQLSKRQIKIVNHLLDNDRPLTTSQLAQHFKVSVRTIKYDLSDIKPWINARQNVLISKRNKGVWIQANGQEKSLIKRSLLKHKKFDYFPDPKQRAQQIIVLFGLTDGYMTTQQLENKLGSRIFGVGKYFHSKSTR
ncbi:HTH domain-containing protein, partial [Loigolactobacillus rennini]|uniref:HTH domain-containing protein n=1 Tax=Loigolactobacillus rennini TaxID=238013 RepID=UPI000A65DA4C